MSLITVDEVVKAAEAFIEENREDFPVGISVEVIDHVVPGQAMLLFLEKPPTTLIASLAYTAGVALLRFSKHIEGRLR